MLAGTLLGDDLASGKELGGLTGPQAWASGLATLAGIALVTHLLFVRAVPWALASGFATGLVGWFAARSAPGRRRWVAIGLALVVLGLIAEPLGGGIKKDPATVSYLLVTAGLGIWAWHGLRCSREALRRESGLFELAGQNAMLAYSAIAALNPALWRILGVESWVADQGWSPWALVGWGGAQTLFILGFAGFALRRGVVLRA